MINIFSEILFQEFGYHSLSNSDFIKLVEGGGNKKKGHLHLFKTGLRRTTFIFRYPLYFIKSILMVIQYDLHKLKYNLSQYIIFLKFHVIKEFTVY